MTANDEYDCQRGVADIPAGMNVNLGWTGFVLDRGRAHGLGYKLADAFLEEGDGSTPAIFPARRGREWVGVTRRR